MAYVDLRDHIKNSSLDRYPRLFVYRMDNKHCVSVFFVFTFVIHTAFGSYSTHIWCIIIFFYSKA